MDFQILGQSNRRVPRQIGRAGAEEARTRSQFLDEEGGAGDLADPDVDIDILFRQIDRCIGQPQIDLELGILRQEDGQQRRQMMDSERHPRMDSQRAAGRELKLRHFGMSIVDLAQDLFEFGAIELARLGEGEFPAGPVQQPGAQHVLKRIDRAEHGGRRQADLPPGRREAAGLHHPHEETHPGQAIHPAIFSDSA